MPFPKNRLHRLREAQGLTKAELADRIGVHERTIYRWETRQTGIPDPRKADLAVLFGCRVGHLMCWDETGDNGDGTGLEQVA